MLVFIHHVLATTTACEKTSPGGARDDAKKFGPLKAALGATLNRLYADHEVRLRSLARNSPSTNTFPGICRCGEQDRKPPLAHKCTGRTI